MRRGLLVARTAVVATAVLGSMATAAPASAAQGNGTVARMGAPALAPSAVPAVDPAGPCANARKAVRRAEAALRGPVSSVAVVPSLFARLDRATRQRDWLCAPLPTTCAAAASAERDAGFDVVVANANLFYPQSTYDASDIRVANLVLWTVATLRDELCGPDGTSPPMS